MLMKTRNLDDEEIIESRAEKIAINLSDAIENSIGETMDDYPLEIRQLHDEFTSKVADFKAAKDLKLDRDAFMERKAEDEYESRYL